MGAQAKRISYLNSRDPRRIGPYFEANFSKLSTRVTTNIATISKLTYLLDLKVKRSVEALAFTKKAIIERKPY